MGAGSCRSRDCCQTTSIPTLRVSCAPARTAPRQHPEVLVFRGKSERFPCARHLGMCGAGQPSWGRRLQGGKMILLPKTWPEERGKRAEMVPAQSRAVLTSQGEHAVPNTSGCVSYTNKAFSSPPSTSSS